MSSGDPGGILKQLLRAFSGEHRVAPTANQGEQSARGDRAQVGERKIAAAAENSCGKDAIYGARGRQAGIRSRAGIVERERCARRVASQYQRSGSTWQVLKRSAYSVLHVLQQLRETFALVGRKDDGGALVYEVSEPGRIQNRGSRPPAVEKDDDGPCVARVGAGRREDRSCLGAVADGLLSPTGKGDRSEQRRHVGRTVLTAAARRQKNREGDQHDRGAPPLMYVVCDARHFL